MLQGQGQKFGILIEFCNWEQLLISLFFHTTLNHHTAQLQNYEVRVIFMSGRTYAWACKYLSLNPRTWWDHPSLQNAQYWRLSRNALGLDDAPADANLLFSTGCHSTPMQAWSDNWVPNMKFKSRSQIRTRETVPKTHLLVGLKFFVDLTALPVPNKHSSICITTDYVCT